MTEAVYNPVVRISELELERNAGPGWFESFDGYVGKMLQLTRLGCAYTEVAWQDGLSLPRPPCRG